MSEEASSSILQPSSDDVGKRLDAYLAEQIDGWSRSRLQRLIENGDVLVNQNGVKASYKLRESDEIDVDLTEAPVAKFEAENIRSILFLKTNISLSSTSPRVWSCIPVPASAQERSQMRSRGTSGRTAAGSGGLTPRSRYVALSDGQPPSTAGGSDLSSANPLTLDESQIRNRVGIVHASTRITSGLHRRRIKMSRLMRRSPSSSQPEPVSKYGIRRSCSRKSAR
jgi:ribosomal 50S subunit-recycling heat shock protein